MSFKNTCKMEVHIDGSFNALQTDIVNQHTDQRYFSLIRAIIFNKKKSKLFRHFCLIGNLQ